MMTPLKALCAVLLAAMSLQASAQEASPAYVGGSWGLRSDYSIKCYAGGNCGGDTNRGGKLYGGYNLGNRIVFGDHKVTDAIELSSFWIDGQYHAVSASPWQTREKTHGVALNWASQMELGSGIALNSRLGLAYSRTRLESRQPEFANTRTDYFNRTGATAGLGLSYSLDGNWSLRADYDYLPIKADRPNGKGHVNMWSLGAAYHF